MEAMNEYHWAQDKIDEVVTGKKHREDAACERRLRQIAARREKEVARQARKADAAVEKERGTSESTGPLRGRWIEEFDGTD